jgi:hypothetical protein
MKSRDPATNKGALCYEHPTHESLYDFDMSRKEDEDWWGETEATAEPTSHVSYLQSN